MNRYFNQMSLFHVSLALMASSVFSSCGKEDLTSATSVSTFRRADEPYVGGVLYHIGDQVRLKVSESGPSGSKNYELSTVISAVGARDQTYLVEQYKIQRTVKTPVSAKWTSAQALYDMAILSPEKLKEVCKRGKIQEITLGTQSLSSCYQAGPYPGGSKTWARCEYWLGVVPFGILKMSCLSKDGRSRLKIEALSASIQGTQRYFD